MALPTLRPHLVRAARLEQDDGLFRLILPPTPADAYADAQVDDYPHDPPLRFANAPPQRLRIRARFSHAEMKGTAGFGFWNHPFDRAGRVTAPPCNAWFFYCSPESSLQVSRRGPAHGFKASALDSHLGQGTGAFGRLAACATRLATPALNLLLRAPGLSGLVLSAARAAVRTDEAALDLDMTAWHEYDLDWCAGGAVFAVDGRPVLRAPRPPRIPLGFVAWVDNYRAAAGGSRSYAFEYVEVTHEQWMEMRILEWSPA